MRKKNADCLLAEIIRRMRFQSDEGKRYQLQLLAESVAFEWKDQRRNEVREKMEGL
jgi:hypothetical protein